MDDAVARRPGVDLVFLLVDQGPAQILSQAHRPQAEHRMGTPARGGAGEVRRAFLHRLRQARDQVSGKERRVAGKGCHPGRTGGMLKRPFQPRQDAGQGTGKALDHVGHHRQAEGREAPWIAVGVEDQPADLRFGALNDMSQ